MKKLFILSFILFSLITTAWASSKRTLPKNIRVLLLDDRFPFEPSNNEKMVKMGNLRGNILVAGISYAGKIEVWKGEKGIYIINELPLEDYVRSVVASEVAEGWADEALKVQAVIARTYAVKLIMKNPDALYHITSSTLHQLYRGNYYDDRVQAAVESTRGEIITYNDQPIEALYHSTCGGMTEDAKEVYGKDIPYLKPVKNDCSLSPYWLWKRVIRKEVIERRLRIKEIIDIRVKEFTKTGRVKTLKIITKKGFEEIPGRDFRRFLGWRELPSLWFAVYKTPEGFVFKGRGYGHGVGLCQWGAQDMAIHGKSYRDIIMHYYRGVKIVKYED